MSIPRLLPYGPRAVLVEYDTLDEVMGVTRSLDQAEWPTLIEVVPASRTVLVVHDGSGLPDEVRALLHAPPVGERPSHTRVEIAVSYEGPDLIEVADRCAMTVDRLIATHSEAEYVVAFCGFVPGFSYLTGLPGPLHLPRRPTPRTSVPSGSVAIANEYSAVYPAATPGGWHLLGRTTACLWDDEREPPALLVPGTTVTFRPV